jgi:hypothetical protein
MAEAGDLSGTNRLCNVFFAGSSAFSGRAWLAEAPIASASEIRALAQAWSIKSYFDQTATVVVMVVAIF